MHSAIAVSAALCTLACAPPLPPQWADGGVPLNLGPAHWERPDDDPIDLDAQGNVYEGRRLTFVLDRAGRVSDDETTALAILAHDGQLLGTSGRYLGYVGNTNASPPDRDVAWLSVQPNGKVQYFDEGGERSDGGLWSGCNGSRHRTCTLVTHLISLRHYGGSSSAVGVGVGVMVPR